MRRRLALRGLAVLLILGLGGLATARADAPRWSALSTLLMWTKADPTGPTEVTAADPLPVTISGDATLDTLTIDEKILLPAGTTAAPSLQWPATGLTQISTAVLGLVNGEVSQEFRVYGTATGGEYLALQGAAASQTVRSSVGNLNLGYATATPLVVSTTGTIYVGEVGNDNTNGTGNPDGRLQIMVDTNAVVNPFNIQNFRSTAGAGIGMSFGLGATDDLVYPYYVLRLTHTNQWTSTASSRKGIMQIGVPNGANPAYYLALDSEQAMVNATADLWLDAPKVTAGSGTGVTVNAPGSARSVVYKVTVLSTNCVAAATTCDLTIATLPAKAFLKAVIADLTTTYACTAVCTTATLSGTLGTSAGGTQLLASMDLDAATAQFGDADAELGASLNAAARSANGALFNGVLMSWGSTTTVTYRITSGTGNLGDGAATNLSQGAMVFYLVTEVFP